MDRRSLGSALGSLPAKGFWLEALKDLLASAGLVLVIVGLLYVYTGIWPPLVSVDGRSMLPNMMPDDLVVVRGLGRVDVVTYCEALASSHRMFNDYGDVIVYRPFGDTTKAPVIHRAMYLVREGEPMWPGGPLAPHTGYITQGDNNFLYDQSSAISQGQPVKNEWIIGVSEYRVPYLGWVRSLIG